MIMQIKKPSENKMGFFSNQTFTCKKYNLEELCVGDTPGFFFWLSLVRLCKKRLRSVRLLLEINLCKNYKKRKKLVVTDLQIAC